MKKTILALSAVLLAFTNANAQEGKPSVKVFSNFNYDLSAEEGENAFKEFEVKRSYLGYSYKFDDKFSAKVTFDVGSNDGGSAYTAFLKIASLNWKASDNLSVNFGQTGTKNFKFMEKAWGKRYIDKSAQDKYKWASSADVGLTADYKVNDRLSIDAQVLNGEGYKKTQSAEGLFRGGMGITYSINENIAMRLHHDVMPRSNYGETDASQTITSAALVYSNDSFTIGAEKNMMKNAGYTLDEERTLTSIYGDYSISDKYSIFGRYDDGSETDKEKTYSIVGVERQMTKGIKVALNIQSEKGIEEDAEAQNTLFLNLEYKF